MKNGRVEYADNYVEMGSYDKKALEIALPDVIISDDIKDVLDTFQNNCKEKGMEVIYKIILD
ncbi:MAG: hypothetical protein E7252_02840 [Lachnospira sp.]|nr:hypothetical protein [Lachnospira sp.]